MTTTEKTRRLLKIQDINNFRRDAPELLDFESAAVFLGVSERALLMHLEEYRIPHKKLGAKRIFSKTALLEWLFPENIADY